MLPLPRVLLLLAVWLLFLSTVQAAAPPRRNPDLEKWEAQLKTQPHHPAILIARAQWRREHFNFHGAITDIEKLLAGKPSALWISRARTLWLLTVSDFFAHDFAAADKQFVSTPRLWNDNQGWLTQGDLSQKPPEHRQVLALYWYFAARRAEGAGKPQSALDALISLVRVNAPGAHLPAKGDPRRRLSFSVWARERHEKLLARAFAAERKALEVSLARQWRDARAKNDIDAMRGVIALVGVDHPLGQEARLYLAGRLGAVGYSPAADQLLQELRRGPNALSAAKAVLELAEMMTRARQMRDSLVYYRILGREYATVQVMPGDTGSGSTGADVLASLATDKRFIGLLEKPGPMIRGPVDLRYDAERKETHERYGFTFAPLREALPFFQQYRLMLVENVLCMWDRESERYEFHLPLRNTGFGTIGGDFNLGHQVRFGHQSLGQIAILNLGIKVVGVDPLGQKVLWQYDVLGLGNAVPDGRAVDFGKDDIEYDARKPRLLTLPADSVKGDSARMDYGIARIDYATGGSLRLGGAVPLTPTRLCLATKKGLTALDPLMGAVCWSRTDVPQDCRLFDDGVHVFVVRFKADGKVAGTAAYRLGDGAPVRIKDFSALYEQRLSIVDGRLLLWEEVAGKAPALRLYAVAAGKDDWRQVFPAGAIPIRCEDPALTGVVQPNGKVDVWEARTKKPVVSFKLPGSHRAGKAKAYRLVGDAENFYLASEEPRSENVQSEPRPLFLPWAGLRTIPVNGNLYAFHRTTGRLSWYFPVENQMLLVSEIERLPMLLLASRHNQWVGKPPIRSIVSASNIRAIAKHNGKLWYDHEDVPPTMYFHTIRVNQGTGKVECMGRGMKISMWAVPK